jgi:acyl carrier protein
MALLHEIKLLLAETLQLDEAQNWQAETPMLGVIAEFDSMAVVSLLTQLEENYGIMIEHDEISADVFATLGSLIEFVAEKVD